MEVLSVWMLNPQLEVGGEMKLEQWMTRVSL